MKQIKSKKFKNMLTGAAACVFTIGAVTANAGFLTITGGTSFTTPSNNNIVTGMPMSDDAAITTNQDNVVLDFYYWGAESGYTNTLNWTDDSGVTTSHSEDNSYNPVPAFTSAPRVMGGTQALAGDIDMFFTSNGWDSSYALSPDSDHSLRSIAFAYVNSDGSYSSTATNIVLFALDDDGGAPDDNHDDYVGYIKARAVPIPAAAWLFGSGLIAMAGLKRRKS